MPRIDIAKRDVFWTYANLGLSSGVNILLLPLILGSLSSAEVGLWYVYSAIGAITLVLDFGLGATLSRQITFAWCGAERIEREGHVVNKESAEPNYGLLQTLTSATRRTYIYVGAVALLIAGSVGTIHVAYSMSGEGSISAIDPSWWVYLAAVWINTSMSYWNPLLRGVGAIAESGQANVAGKLSQLILTAILLLCGLGLTGVAAGYLLSSFLFRYLSRRYFRTASNVDLRAASPWASNVDLRSVMGTIWPNAWKQGLVSISQYAMTSVPVLVASSFLGLDDAAAVGLTVQLVGIIKVFGNALFNAYLPKFSSLRMAGDLGELRSRLALSLGVATYSILLLGSLAMLLAPFALGAFGSSVSVLAIGPALVFVLSEWAVNQYALCSGYIGTGNRVPMHWAYVWTALATAVLQVAAAALTDWGVWAIVLPPLLVSAVYNDWYWFRAAARDVRLRSASLLASTLVEPTRLVMRVVRRAK